MYTFIIVFNIFEYDLRLILAYCEKIYTSINGFFLPIIITLRFKHKISCILFQTLTTELILILYILVLIN